MAKRELASASSSQSGKQDLRFDVPTIGLRTVETMVRCGVTAMSVEAGKTLMIDRAELIERANAVNIAIVAVE